MAPAEGGCRREGWAALAAAIPEGARRERERPFWQALAVAWGWRRVVDAGCGSGFHLALLGENPATGYQVSKKAGIPRSMVYEALGRLRPAAFDWPLFLAALALMCVPLGDALRQLRGR